MDTPTTNRMAANYLEGLRAYLTDGSATGFRLAHEIGSEAVVNGLDILVLARIHDTACEALLPPGTTPAMREELEARANGFFTEAILPIEKNHAAALNDRVELAQVTDQLHQHTLALEDSNREIQQEIAARHHAEAALVSYEKTANEERAESRMLEQQLQDSVRRILCATEVERTKMSQVLQHEIAQALLGIKVRLLALESEASANQLSLSHEINTTHWLVETSAKTLSNLIREFSSLHA
jgi:hypothetical protein